MNPRADLRRIAAEYVIGTLDAAERADWRARMAEDPEIAALVSLWEHRLAPLNELSAPARPPEGLFDAILARLPAPPAEPEAVQEDVVSGAVDSVPEDQGASESAAAPMPDTAGTQDAPVPADDASVNEGSASGLTEPEGESVAEGGEGQGETSGPAEIEGGIAESEQASDASVQEVTLPETGPGAETPAPPEAEAVPDPAEAHRQPEPPAAEPADSVHAADPAEPESARVAVAPEVRPAAEASHEATPPASQALVPDEDVANPWRRASGVLMLVLLLGGGAFAYRELHHRPVPPPPEPPKQAEAAPEPPPPAPEPAPDVPGSFAVLGPQPVPAIGFAFDHKTGAVSVLKMAAPPSPGMRYHLWLLTDFDGPRHVASFDSTGTFPSDLLQDVDAATLAGALLVVTEEPEGPPPFAPSRAPVFSGMAVRR